MIVKLAIIVGLVILGGLIFSNEIVKLFPSTASTVPDLLKSDVEKISNETTGFVDDKLSETSEHITQAVNDTTGSIIDNVQDIQERVINETSGLNPFDSVQDILTDNKNDDAE